MFRLSPQTSPRVKRVIQAHNHHSQDQTWLHRTFPNPAAVWTCCISVRKLPPHLSSTHDAFHVSQLKKCLRVLTEAIEIEAIQLEPDLTYQERPIKILDQKERVTRRRSVKSYKVQWSNHSEEEATWETEDYLRTHYPEFLH